MKFEPADITVKVGEQVKFVWEGFLPHEVVTSDGDSCKALDPHTLSGDAAADYMNSGIKVGSGQFVKTFKVPGDVYYQSRPHCSLGMKGHIKVVP